MKKGMLLIFWGLMFLTLTIVELPWEGLVWGFNMIGYGLCAIGMMMNFRSSELQGQRNPRVSDLRRRSFGRDDLLPVVAGGQSAAAVQRNSDAGVPDL